MKDILVIIDIKSTGILLLQVKDYPGFNFISLLYGPGSDTQKRLEKVRDNFYLLYQPYLFASFK